MDSARTRISNSVPELRGRFQVEIGLSFSPKVQMIEAYVSLLELTHYHEFWGFCGSPVTLSSLSRERKPERHNQRVRGFASPRNQNSLLSNPDLPFAIALNSLSFVTPAMGLVRQLFYHIFLPMPFCVWQTSPPPAWKKPPVWRAATLGLGWAGALS